MKSAFLICCAINSVCLSAESSLKEISYDAIKSEFQLDLDRFFEILNGDVDTHISSLYSDEYHEKVRLQGIKHNFGSNLIHKRRNDSRFEIYKVYYYTENIIITTYRSIGSEKTEDNLSAYWIKDKNKWSLGVHNMQTNDLLYYIKNIMNK
jgi:hypothetical protein